MKRWRWQNLNESKRKLLWGRGWWGRWRLEVVCPKKTAVFYVQLDGTKGEISAAAWLLWFQIYLSFSMRLQHISGSRQVCIAFHDRGVWWSFWLDPMGGWSSSTPRWRQGCFHPIDFLLGREKCEVEKVAQGEVIIPMPEGCYLARCTKEIRIWKRPRWPKVRRNVSYDLHIPGGIPHAGKGTESYNCGDDGLCGISGSTREQAVGNAVASVLRDRRRYGEASTMRGERKPSPNILNARKYRE